MKFYKTKGAAIEAARDEYLGQHRFDSTPVQYFSIDTKDEDGELLFSCKFSSDTESLTGEYVLHSTGDAATAIWDSGIWDIKEQECGIIHH